MALPQGTSSSTSLANSPTPKSTTPLEVSQQIQRVEALHQQLKLEAQRAQEFLLKLRRGELEAQTQAQLQLERRQKEHEESGRRKEADGKEAMCTCSCPHHGAAPPPPSPPPSLSPNHPGSTAAQNRNSFNANGTINNNLPIPPLNFPTKVDEKEVRDLEKRVRGLEGRVRGFEGLPPDREMALMEVERLRRELEGLARRREGLFEGLGCDEALNFGNGGGKPYSSDSTVDWSPKTNVGKAGATSTGVGQKSNGRPKTNGAKTSGKGRRRG